MRVVQYINKNIEEVDEEILNSLNQKINLSESGQAKDTLERLENLTKPELAEAYDNLYAALQSRQLLLEKRFKSTYHHYGLEERIMFGGRDFKRD